MYVRSSQCDDAALLNYFCCIGSWFVTLAVWVASSLADGAARWRGPHWLAAGVQAWVLQRHRTPLETCVLNCISCILPSAIGMAKSEGNSYTAWADTCSIPVDFLSHWHVACVFAPQELDVVAVWLVFGVYGLPAITWPHPCFNLIGCCADFQRRPLTQSVWSLNHHNCMWSNRITKQHLLMLMCLPSSPWNRYHRVDTLSNIPKSISASCPNDFN